MRLRLSSPVRPSLNLFGLRNPLSLVALTVVVSGAMAAAAGAQVVAWTARKNGGFVEAFAEASAVAVGPTGNVYVTGRASSESNCCYDYLTLAYDAAGNLLWARTRDGIDGSSDEPVAVAVDVNGNVFVTGWAARGHYPDFFTVAYDSAGNELWARTKSSEPFYGRDRARGIAVGANGSVFVTGETGLVGGVSHFMTVAYSASGDELWARLTSVGESDRAWGVAVSDSGTVFAAGETSPSLGDSDFLTVAYDDTGNELWTRVKDGPDAQDDVARDLAVDGSGHVHVAGVSEAGTVNDYLTVTYDEDGNELWARTKNGAAGLDDSLFAVAVDAAGNVYLTGSSDNGVSQDVLTVSYDPAGIERWSAVKDGPESGDDAGYAIAIDGSASVYLTGRAIAGSGTHQSLTLAYGNGTGTELWARLESGGPSRSASGAALAVGAAGALFVAGGSASGTESDFLTLAYDASGNQLWARAEPPIATPDRPGGPSSSSWNRSMAIDSNGRVYVTGRTEDGTTGDFLTAAFDSAGVELWTAQRDGHAGGYAAAAGVALDESTGRVYVTGTSSIGFAPVFLTVAYDELGNELWARTTSGSSSSALPCCIAVGSNGHVVVVGYSLGGPDLLDDFLTVAYDSQGNELWLRERDNGAGTDDRATALAVGPSGNVYVAGGAISDFQWDVLTVAYDSSGNELWSRLWDGEGHSDDVGFDLEVGPDENVFVAGDSSDVPAAAFLTLRYDRFGNEVWATRSRATEGSAAGAYDIEVDPSGRVFVFGDSSTGSPDFVHRFMTVGYDFAGEELWVRERTSESGRSDFPHALALGEDGTVYVTGATDNGFDKDFLTVAYSPAGNERFEFTYDGGGADVAYLASAPAAGGVIMGGYSQQLREDYFLVRLLEPAPLFADGFESGDAGAWSVTFP